MGRKLELTGKRFGRLTVISMAYNDGYGTYWNCKCDCGNETIVKGALLTYGNTKSCGCQRAEAFKRCVENGTKHNLSHHPLYPKWKSMRKRCSNPNEKEYKNYGGRGITVCEEWDDFKAFYDWAITHGWREDLTIDRIDNNKGYSPDNCRFIPAKEQVRNRRKTVYLEYNNEKRPLSEWCELLGLKMKTCYGRLHYYGWSNPEEILFGRRKRG